MLNKETEDQLKVLGFDVSKLSEAIKATEEVKLDVPKLFTEATLMQSEKVKSYGENRFKEGKEAISEILAKEFYEKHDLKDVERKNLEKVIEAIAEKKVADHKIEPNKKVEELKKENEELKVLVNKTKEEKEKEVTTLKGDLETFKTKNELYSYVPDNVKIGKEDVVTLFLNKYRVHNDESGRTVVENGEGVIKDDVLNPKKPKDVFQEFLNSGNYLTKEGMGGNDTGGSGSSTKFKSVSEFYDWCTKQGKNPMDKEMQSLLSESKEENFQFN